jgi:hypothetical protein
MQPQKMAPRNDAIDVRPLIEDKLSGIEREIADAIAEQEFERCVELKPRANKLKAMLTRARQGLPVDPAEVNAV